MLAVVKKRIALGFGLLFATILFIFNTMGFLGTQWYVSMMPEAAPIYQIRHGAHSSAKALQKLIPQKQIWRLNLHHLNQEILKSSPWFKKVHIRRKFPNLLMINVVEHQFIARDNDVLISNEGAVVQVPPGFQTVDLIQIEGRVDYKELLDFWHLLKVERIVPDKIIYRKYGGWSIQIDGFLVQLSPKRSEVSLKTFIKWCEINKIKFTQPLSKRAKKVKCIIRIIKPPRVLIEMLPTNGIV